jgi:hypothetical protein
MHKYRNLIDPSLSQFCQFQKYKNDQKIYNEIDIYSILLNGPLKIINAATCFS